MIEQTLARRLSLFSLGLGFAELLAPRQVARLAGINEDHDLLIRLLGLREISSGLGIMQGKPGPFLWSRVAGDALDISLLLAAMRSPNNDRRRLNYALAAVVGVTALDVLATILSTRDQSEPGWRVSGHDRYAAGFERTDPVSLRACCEDAMADQSGHVWDRGDPADFQRETPPGNPLDPLAGHDESPRPEGASTTPMGTTSFT